jgi:hypothetical protein
MGNFTKDKSLYFLMDLGFVYVRKCHKKTLIKRRKPAARVTDSRLSDGKLNQCGTLFRDGCEFVDFRMGA